jgi:hypothetical protein
VPRHIQGTGSRVSVSSFHMNTLYCILQITAQRRGRNAVTHQWNVELSSRNVSSLGAIHRVLGSCKIHFAGITTMENTNVALLHAFPDVPFGSVV